MGKKIGSLWKHKKDNKTYLTGNIEIVAGISTKITVFLNEKKEANSKQPDYNIVLSETPKPDSIKVVTEKINDDI